MNLIIYAFSVIQLVGSVVFFLKQRQSYLRSKALHNRFLVEEQLCDAARNRGDYKKASEHLAYMKVLHDAHDE